MKLLSNMRACILPTTALIAAGLLSASSAVAQSGCGICDQEVVINSDLAICFLEKYAELVGQSDGAIVVDLSQCGSRSIVAAIPGPEGSVEEPQTQFMLSRPQLDCLKSKLEEPGLVLDPSAKIDLGSCG